MRIIFMGTPEFSVPALKRLQEDSSYDIVAVITATDKYGGRGRKQIIKSAVKRYALEQGLKVMQPKNLKSTEFVNELRNLEADLQVVVAFRMLPEIVWNMPSIGTMNLHASLLPAYRGAAPINWAIINGETETGLTTFLLKHEIDTGDMLLQESVPIYLTDTAGDLHDRMMPIGAELVLRSVRKLESGNFQLIPQDVSKVSKAPKIYHEDCQIRFDQPTKKIYDFIRGLSPYPGAWTRFDDKEVKIFSTRILANETNGTPGKILSDGKNFIRILTLDGTIQIEEIKMAGKRKMPVKDFLNGYSIESPTVEG